MLKRLSRIPETVAISGSGGNAALQFEWSDVPCGEVHSHFSILTVFNANQ